MMKPAEGGIEMTELFILSIWLVVAFVGFGIHVSRDKGITMDIAFAYAALWALWPLSVVLAVALSPFAFVYLVIDKIRRTKQ